MSDIISEHCNTVGKDKYGLTLCSNCPASVRHVCYENSKPVQQGFEAIEKRRSDLIDAIILLSEPK